MPVACVSSSDFFTRSLTPPYHGHLESPPRDLLWKGILGCFFNPPNEPNFQFPYLDGTVPTIQTAGAESWPQSDSFLGRTLHHVLSTPLLLLQFPVSVLLPGLPYPTLPTPSTAACGLRVPGEEGGSCSHPQQE